MRNSAEIVGLSLLLALISPPSIQGTQLRASTAHLPVLGHHSATSAGRNSISADQSEAVRKPVTDKRNYAHTVFNSGLHVLVVHDPDAEKSAFAMAVEVGSHEDPEEFQGLAHFCEHMLFLGSEKYPDQDGFSQYLALHGGQDNAYTASDKTVFFNEVGDDGLEKSLDMFAQFFISPTFKEDMADKEIHAVDSEHKKNIPNMNWRIRQLLLSVASSKNPNHKFATGDIDTLKHEPEQKGKSVVSALRKFHSAHYCSSRMHLVLVSNMTTGKLMELAHTQFDGIPKVDEDECAARGNYSDHPAYSRELGNLGLQFTVGTEGSPELWLSFPLPPLEHHYKQLAEAYVWNALGHFGPGGLKAKLLDEDLSHSFSYYAQHDSAGSIMFMTFSLTNKGLKNWELLLEYFFSYLAVIRSAGVDKALLESMRQVRQVDFDYQESRPSEFDFVNSLAGGLPTYGPTDLLTGGILIDEPDVNLIGQVLEALVPDNMNVVLVKPTFNDTMASRREPHYHFGYERADLDEKFLQRWKGSSSHDLEPPPVLKYAPSQLDVIKASAGESGPERLEHAAGVEAWWLGIGGVKLPKAVVTVKLGVPTGVMDSIEAMVLASMHARLVEQELEAPSDALQTCGLSYSFSSLHDGFQISFSGFDQHLGELMDLVLPVVHSPKNSDKYFEAARRQMIIDLSDITQAQPYEHAIEALDVVTLKGKFPRAELLAAAQDEHRVSLASYHRFLNTFFEKAHASALFAGNLDKARAAAMSGIIGFAVELKDHDHDEHNSKMQVLKPEEELEIHAINPITGDENSATIVTYQFGVPTIADRVHFAILSEVMSRPCFESLRTQHQLGYVVFGFAQQHASIVEVRVIVQGASKSPDIVESLIEETVQNITGLIEHMSQDEFNERKATLRTELTKKDSTMGEYAARHWEQISEQTYCFDKRHYQLEYLDSEAFKEPASLLETWKRTVAPSPHRKKISVKLFSGSEPALASGPVLHKGPHTIDLSQAEHFQGDEHQAYWSTEYICENPH